jgi:hypothetical protein
MSKHIYKLLELTGSSTISSDDAVQVALRKRLLQCGTSNGSKFARCEVVPEGGQLLRWHVTSTLACASD